MHILKIFWGQHISLLQTEEIKLVKSNERERAFSLRHKLVFDYFLFDPLLPFVGTPHASIGLNFGYLCYNIVSNEAFYC